MKVAFVVLAGLMIVAAVATVSLRRSVHSMLALIACLVSVAGVYLLLGAEFVGLMQIVVYIGAVAILIVFAMMMTQQYSLEEEDNQPHVSAAGWLSAVCALGLTAWSIFGGAGAIAIGGPHQTTVRDIGVALMHESLLPMELLGLLLTVALLGAGVIALDEGDQR